MTKKISKKSNGSDPNVSHQIGDAQVAVSLAMLAKVHTEAEGLNGMPLVASRTERSPLLETLSAYWGGYNELDRIHKIPGFITAENEDALFAEHIGQHAQRLQAWDAPAESLEEAIIALDTVWRHVAGADEVDEDDVGFEGDPLATAMFKAALDYLKLARRSLIGIGAPGERSAADLRGNETLLDVIHAYRAGVMAYADHPEFVSHDEENEVARAADGVHAAKLDKWDASANSREEAMEALKFALEDAAQWCGSATTSTMIKAALGYLEEGERPADRGASTDGDDAAAGPMDEPSNIDILFRRWKDAEAREDASDNDEDADLIHVEYNALQEQLTKETPKTASELAMILIAATDRWAAQSMTMTA